MGLTPLLCSASELKPELLCVKHRRDGKRYVHVIEGMANAKIPDIFETSMQDWDYPDGPTTHSGLTVDKFINLMLSSLSDGNTDNVMFVSRELYLMKCFTPPIGQSSKSVYTPSLNRFYKAVLHYVVACRTFIASCTPCVRYHGFSFEIPVVSVLVRMT